MIKNFIRRIVVSSFIFKINTKASNFKYEKIQLAFILPLQKYSIYKFFFKSHPNTIELSSFTDILFTISKTILFTDYRYKNKIKSDLLIGFGEAFHRSSSSLNKSILYTTGSSGKFQDEGVKKEIDFIGELNFTPNLLNYFRSADNFSFHNENNAVIILNVGNRFTKNTFIHNSNKVISLPGIPLKSRRLKFNVINRKKILWMGSKGILHKGLHIACEFANKLNLELIVIGISKEEKIFAEYILKESGCNYKLYGYVGIPSKLWYQITNDISFVLGVSISEGMSTSILTSIYRGLYPITVDRCGIDYGSIISFLPRNSLVDRLCNSFINIIEKNDNFIFEQIVQQQKKIDIFNSKEKFDIILSNTINNYD